MRNVFIHKVELVTCNGLTSRQVLRNSPVYSCRRCNCQLEMVNFSFFDRLQLDPFLLSRDGVLSRFLNPEEERAVVEFSDSLLDGIFLVTQFVTQFVTQ